MGVASDIEPGSSTWQCYDKGEVAVHGSLKNKTKTKQKPGVLVLALGCAIIPPSWFCLFVFIRDTLMYIRLARILCVAKNSPERPNLLWLTLDS